ncbi:MAG: diguanylate cyclase (GGDEF)-like protein [Janthinobacterium sp.]|jgi:diguanylate cyclase (GGDEF)-like protein
MKFGHNLPWIQRHSIATKLMLVNLSTSACAIFLAGMLLLAIQVYLAGIALLEHARTEAAMTGANLAAALVFNDRKSATEVLSTLRAFSEISNATVFDANNQVFALYARQAAPAIVPYEGKDFYRFTSTRLILGKSFDFRGAHLGTIYINADLAPSYRRLFWYAAAVALVMLMSLALAYAVLVRLQRCVTAPLLALAQTSERISKQRDFSIRADVHASADIGSLASAFNAMLDQIEAHEAELKSEISERRRVEVKLDRLAHFDNVTGLHNRHFFNDRLTTVVNRARTLSERAVLMFLDLDNFKAVNDMLGHEAGDELLKIVSARLERSLRFGDTVSRIGGDEFAIILENVPIPAIGVQVAEKCLAALSEVFHINGTAIYITGSIGIVSCPDDGIEMQTLLKYSDTAMYCAKNAGKNTYKVFTPCMQSAAQMRFSMESNLRRALELDQFLLLYQPKIDLCSGRIIGVEALIRWRHPELGMISPVEFIAIAEETGLIIPIGNWVLRTACRQLADWHRAGWTRLQMAVNISGGQLRQDLFVPQMLGIIADTGAPPHALELELTESMLMDADRLTIAKLDAIRSAGIALAIDDFGTGYSSMSYLKLFPINTLKIDRSFVHELPMDAKDAAIATAIIALARSLKLDVVAEGVETAEQAAFLAAAGCSSGQGFFYSEPVAPEQVIALITGQQNMADDGLDGMSRWRAA